MFAFTKQERLALSLFVLIILSGSAIEYAFKQYPLLRDIVNLIDSDKIYSKVNINTASWEALVDVPYIGEYTATNIIDYRQANGPFANIKQIKNVRGIKEKNYERFYKHLKI